MEQQSSQRNLERCIRAAKLVGVPQDQVKNLLGHGYAPLPWQWEFHAVARLADNPDGPVDVGLGGARGPGKSHCVLSQAALDDCQRIPGLKGLFLRQTGIAAQESFDDLVDKVVKGRVQYKKTGSVLSFPNGSRVLLGGFQYEKDIDKYIGIEYDFIIVEELNQITEDKYTKLRGSLRTSKQNWRPRMYTSFNPGGIGHQFVKERYILPHMKDTQKETRFIAATYKQNPYLNKEYISYLESLTGELGRAWREGDWDIFAGQAFTEFRQKTHMIKAIKPNATFEHGLSIDWGYTEKKPCAFSAYLHALIKMKLPDGQNFHRVITYMEWSGNMKKPREWARIMYEDCLKMGIKPKRGIADSSMFNPSSDYGKSISDLFMDEWRTLNGDNSWLLLGKGTKDRIGRKATTHDWLSIAPDGLPYWMITENCYQLLTTLPILQVDEHNFEDVDTNGLDDCLLDNTPIITDNGTYQIKDLVGKTGKVLSINNEWVDFSDCRLVRKDSKVITLLFENGTTITCTPDHKILTTEGMTQAQDLKGKQCVLSHEQFKNLTEKDIISLENTTKRMAKCFTEQSGNITMGKLITLKSMYIISILIKQIIKLKILWRYLHQITEHIIHISKTPVKNIWTQSEQKQGNGINRKQDMNGTRNITKTSKINFTRKLIEFVRFAQNNTKQKIRIPNTAQIIVAPKQDGIPASIISWAIAKGAEKYSQQINTYRKNAVQNHAVLTCVGLQEVEQKHDTYCLVADKYHLFSLANGVIVSNCYDSCTYYLYGGVKFIGVKAGTINYDQGVAPVKVQFNTKGEQIPFDSKVFAEQYEKNT